MKKIISILIVSMFFVTGVKAENLSNFDLESMSYEDVLGDLNFPNIVEPDSAGANPVKAPSRDLKEWTVMFYASTKDVLRKMQVVQMLEMKKAGFTDKVNIVVEAGMPIKDADGSVSTTTLRMVFGEGMSVQNIEKSITEFFKNHKRGDAVDYSALKPFEADIVKRTSDKDMGDWKNIANFTKWAKTNYPAKRYVFIIYGHGNGFFDQKKQQPDKGISSDAQTGNYVTLPEFAMLMEETGKVDVLIMQSCLMQMAEVIYQVKDYADVTVGSSELMWSIGYDFDIMLETLNSNSSISNENLGKLLANGYIERLKMIKKEGHASVIGSSKFPGFIDKLNEWAESVISVGDKKIAMEGIKNVVRFDVFGITTSTSAAIAQRFSMSGDLYDFVEIVTEKLPRNTPEQKNARQKGRELMNYISNDLVYNYAYTTGQSSTGYDFSRAHGISLHVPPVKMLFGSLEGFENNSETLYWDLPFARDTKWGDFLKWSYEEK